jgi:hypothetical protein
MHRLLLFVSVALIAGLAACGDDVVGPLGTTVGGPCVVHEDCAHDSVCLEGREFPGGMCSIYCQVNEHCPPGSMCVETKGGTCQQSCVIHQDCRAGYACKGKKREDKQGEALVCLKD